MSKKFSLKLLERNAKGELTGRTRSFSSDSPYKIWEFWSRNSSNTKRKRKTDSAGTSSEKDVGRWIKEANEYASKKKKNGH